MSLWSINMRHESRLSTTNNSKEKSKPIRKYLPEKLIADDQYNAWKDFILYKITGYNERFSKVLNKSVKGSPIKEPQDYDFHMTVVFNHRQFDHKVIEYTSLLIRRINKRCTRGNFASTGRYIQGFAFAEYHQQSIKMEGCMHLHIMGYFPDTFKQKRTLDELKAIAQDVADKMNANAKMDNIHVVSRAQKALDKAENKLKKANNNLNNPDKNDLKKAVKKAEDSLTEAWHKIENLIFAGNGVKVDEAYHREGLLKYVSKKLDKDILDKRIMALGPNGLDGYMPSSTNLNQNVHGFWTNSEARKWNSVGTATNPAYR
jgi:hypothetical protein